MSTALLDSRSYSQCKATSVATYISMVTTDLLLPYLLSILCSQPGYCPSSSCTLFDTGMCSKDRIQLHHMTSLSHVRNVGLMHADGALHSSNVVQWFIKDIRSASSSTHSHPTFPRPKRITYSNRYLEFISNHWDMNWYQCATDKWGWKSHPCTTWLTCQQPWSNHYGSIGKHVTSHVAELSLHLQRQVCCLRLLLQPLTISIWLSTWS